MRKAILFGEHSITVPAHSEIAKGTLNDIFNYIRNEAALWANIPKDQLIEMFQEL